MSLKYYNLLKDVPDSSLREIQAGRLKGKSDINPQWRIQKLTEVFGVCGIGWKFTVEKQWIEPTATGETACFVNINLFVKIEDIWSDGIPGNGGSMFIANERNGPFVSDECFKMATTDAIGTAARMLGLASDVYMGLKNKNIGPQTKYDKKEDLTPQKVDARPWLNKGEKLDAAIQYLISGGNIAKIEERYKISKEVRESLSQTINKL
jgi:hypothetical protein